MSSILDLPMVAATRRNHALEHATLHVLAAKYPKKTMAGHSNPTGFFILGDVPLEQVTEASVEALRRLRAGESHLAIHPGCGTNMATSILMGATLGWFVMRGARSTTAKMLRLPVALGLAVLGVALSRPLGPMLQQRITTDANMGDMRITDVRHSLKGRLPAHRIMTAA